MISLSVKTRSISTVLSLFYISGANIDTV